MLAAIGLCFINSVYGQVDLEVVWQRYMYPTEISFAKWSVDGNYIYCAVGNNIQKLDANTGQWISAFDNTSTPPVYGADMMAIRYSDDEIITNYGSYIYIWDILTEKVKRVIYEPQILNGCIGITPDEKYLIIESYNKDHKGFIVYNYKKNKIDTVINFEHMGWVNAFSHDGKYFAIGSSYEDFYKKWHQLVTLWETGTWKKIAVLEDIIVGSSKGYRNLKFSDDDKYLAVVRENYKAAIYDLNVKQIIHSSDLNRYCMNAAFIPDLVHYLIFYVTQNNEYELELHNLSTKLKTYNYQDHIIESFGGPSNWKIFYGGGRDTFYVFKNRYSGVEEPEETKNKLNIFTENGNVSIQIDEVVTDRVEIIIYDLLGKNIYSEVINDGLTGVKYNLKTNLATGVYICKFIIGKKEYSKKFEIVR